MFGGHIWELLIVLALALVVFGPKRLPEIGGAMGKGIKEFRKGTSEPADLDDRADARPSRPALTSSETTIPFTANAGTSEQRAPEAAAEPVEPATA